ncbi:hypothetical protein BDQ17DRAFT_1396913 [Cyathus striatus]|nr:hypothetical protein BDQ17DRAFT_1396913 [Cyathus striatus]
MSTPDDLPWPELGNVSRGATRGNQGQKGVLGPPDLQPGVLAVRLNRTASEWYRILDNEVNRALKLTKTYWRKARRRQDYDARPPYIMPDDVELTFLRKFIERQAAGIPHNPRLRNSLGDATSYTQRDHSIDSLTPEPSDSGFMDRTGNERVSEDSNGQLSHSRMSGSPSFRNPDNLMQEAHSSKQALQAARMSLLRAQKDTQDAFMKYTACLDIERQARQAVTTAEKRRDDIMALLLAGTQSTMELRSRNSSSMSEDDHHRSPPRYHPGPEDMRNVSEAFLTSRMGGAKGMDWADADGQGIYANESAPQLEDQSARSRKHTRTWEHGTHLQDPNYSCEDMTALPPKKRVHHTHPMMPSFDVMSNGALQPQNITLQP